VSKPDGAIRHGHARACVREREGASACVRASAYERASVCSCVREGMGSLTTGGVERRRLRSIDDAGATAATFLDDEACVCMCVCVCVCARARACVLACLRERERESARVRACVRASAYEHACVLLNRMVLQPSDTLAVLVGEPCPGRPAGSRRLLAGARTAATRRGYSSPSGRALRVTISDAALCKSKDKIQIDHIILFNILYDEFLRDKKDIPTFCDDNFYNSAIFKKEDKAFENEWIEYHMNHSL
jgi:hypothetical protein